MVGNLSEQVAPFFEVDDDNEQASKEIEEDTITLDLTHAQLQAIQQQWNPYDRHRPTQFVLRLEGQPVGVLHVVSSLFRDPAP